MVCLMFFKDHLFLRQLINKLDCYYYSYFKTLLCTRESEEASIQYLFCASPPDQAVCSKRSCVPKNLKRPTPYLFYVSPPDQAISSKRSFAPENLKRLPLRTFLVPAHLTRQLVLNAPLHQRIWRVFRPVPPLRQPTLTRQLLPNAPLHQRIWRVFHSVAHLRQPARLARKLVKNALLNQRIWRGFHPVPLLRQPLWPGS